MSLKINKTQIIAVIFMISTFVQTSFSAEFESMDRIKAAAKTFVLSSIDTNPGESIEVQVNQSHTAFQVPACANELNAEYPKNSNTEQLTSVEISCNNPQPWHIYVPVDVQVFSKVIVAKRTLTAKESITEDDISYTVYDKNRLYSGYFTSKEQVIGNEARHLITAGSVLTRKNVQLPLLVHRNQLVNLIAQSNSIIVTMQGIAKSDGALNDIIKVYNPSSKRTMDAIVTGTNKAQVSA